MTTPSDSQWQGTANGCHNFDKTLERIAKIVNKTWLCRYPWCCYLIYDNGSKLKMYFEYLCKSYGIKREPTTVKNSQANHIFERVHQVFGHMLHTAEIDMADSVTPDDNNVFLDNAADMVQHQK
jgi:hypothetical protein